MLGLDNPLHIAFLLVLLLLVFGAKRLPEMGKSLGSGLRGFKDSLTGDDHPTVDRAAVSEPTSAPATMLEIEQPLAVPAQEHAPQTVAAGH